MGTQEADFDKLTDEDLYDMGMYRCPCGSAFYPPGGGVRHCEKDR